MLLKIIFIGFFSLSAYAKHDGHESNPPCSNLRLSSGEQMKCDKDEAKKECKEAQEQLRIANKEFQVSCSPFTDGRDCRKIVNTCQLCLDEDEYDGIDCVKVHKVSKCPQMSGAELKRAKEDREKASEKKKDFEDAIKDLKTEILTKQNKANDTQTEFQTKKSDLETTLLKDRKQLDDDLETKQQEINSSLEEELLKINKEIADALKVRHRFENAVSDAHKRLRIEKNKIYGECRLEANGRLAAYRQQRRRAIAQGRFKKTNIKKLMQKNRVSFSQKDNARFKSYYSICLKGNLTQIKELETQLKDSLKRIGQLKKEYIEKIRRLKDQAASKSKASTNRKTNLVNIYYKNLHDSLKTFGKQERGNEQTYQRDQAQISKEISILQDELQQKRGALEETRKKEAFNRELAAHLEKKGTKESESNTFGEVIAKAVGVDSETDNLTLKCHCLDNNSLRTDKVCDKYTEKGTTTTVDKDGKKVGGYVFKDAKKISEEFITLQYKNNEKYKNNKSTGSN